MSDELRLRLVNRFAGETQVLEAQELIEAKARHILLHYATNILPNRFKAMIVANSRAATVRYQAALMKARDQLIETLEHLAPSLLEKTPEQRTELSPSTQMLLQAYPQRNLLRYLDCAAVISAEQNDDPEWKQWSDPKNRDEYIQRFKLPLLEEDKHLAFLMCPTNVINWL